MKNRIKIITTVIITMLAVIGITITSVIATVSDLSELKGTGSSKIGEVFKLSYSGTLKGNKGSYCIQKGKNFNGGEKNYILKSYVEINGRQAKVYDEKNSSGKIVTNLLNAQVAYILSKNEGYGSHENPTDAQNALWTITNDWTTQLFGNTDYVWNNNSTASRNSLNTEAERYADNVGDQLATETTSKNDQTAQVIPVKDLTKKSQLSVMSEAGYYRVGPFRWEFGGTLQDITVKGDSGDISKSNVRFIKYTGTTANEVNISDILTGEVFYVDISQSAGVSALKGLTLKTSASTSGDSSKIYTAKIWFFHSSGSQNIIYVDTGDSTGNPSDGTGNGEYDVPFSTSLGLKKVDDRDQSKPLVGVGFNFSATIQTYDAVSSTDHYKNVSCTHVSQAGYYDENNVYHNPVYQHEYDTVLDWTQYTYEWVDHTMYLNRENTWSDSKNIFYTDNSGNISISNIKYPTKTITNESYKGESKKVTARLKEGTNITATEVSNPYYGYTTGNTYTLTLNSGTKLANKTVTNHQKLVKLSGYVWIDSNSGKTDVRSEEYENGESGFNEITVYLRDKNGNEVKKTTTSELGLYSEINGGEYQFVDVDLDKLQAGEYYVEFEYCGIDYQSVLPILDKNNGSKAIDTNTRNVLDNKFASVNSSGNQSLHINDVTVNYNNTVDHVSTVNNHTGCNVYARTNEAGYNLYSGFTPTLEEIRYVNLGLYKKPQVDYALAQDLYDVRVDVNGFSHVYRYGTTRYTNNGQIIDEESSWNVGVKFQKNSGTYARAIYKADAEYEAPNHKDNEIKAYVTYKVALKNESSYLGRINNIVDYCDIRYELIAAGTSVDDKDNITGNINFGQKTAYNDSYSKYVIETNSVVKPGETNYVYLQFKMDRNAVLAAVNDNGKLLNNVVEINSYTTFKDNNVNTPVAVIDQDSVIGNAIPGQIDTYEDDTDAARSLKLELKDARAIVGTVFVDSTGKDTNTVYKNQERKGNGQFDNGETTVPGVVVTLHEVGKDDSSYDGERKSYNTTTDKDGNFEIVGYIPGNYVLTYTWGNETYKVQYYKGTIYDESRDQSNKYWYRDDNVDIRKTDALDSSEIRQKIDDEMESLKYNTLENEINKAYNGGSEYIKTTTMDSSTPTMSFSVEYLTTITDGTGDQVKFTVKNVDFGIVERPKQQLEFSKRVSGYKITLANGQILVDAEIGEDGKIKGTHDHTTYMGPNGTNSNGLIRTEMDNEMIEGATLEVTYIMKVTNVSELDYVSENYYYYGNKKNSDVVRASVTELLDYVDGRLSVVDNNWSETDKNHLNIVNASQKDNSETTRNYITNKLSKELAPNESNTVTLHTSKLLTSTDDNTFNNKAEITEVTKKPGFNTGTPTKVVWNVDKFNFNIDNAEEVIIIPSTGEDKNYALPIIIGISSLILLGVGAFGIKKFVIDNK